MKVNIGELYQRLDEQAFRYKKAVSNGIMVKHEAERTRNVLMNSLDEIVEALKIAAEAEETIKRLEAEVDSADAELKELDDEIKRLQSGGTGKQNKGKAKAEPVSDVQ